MDSGVTNNHVTQLGILLGLPQDIMHTLKAQSDSGPQVYAMKTITKWLMRDPKSIGDNIQETFVELENQLRIVHLNCVIGRLRRKGTTQSKLLYRNCSENKSIIVVLSHCIIILCISYADVAPDLTDLVGKMTENMTREESLDFGMKLGLNQTDISDVIRESGSGDHCRAPFIALAVYKEAERRHTFLDHSFVLQVGNALRTANTSTFDEEKEDHFKNRIESIEDNSIQYQPIMTASEPMCAGMHAVVIVLRNLS